VLENRDIGFGTNVYARLQLPHRVKRSCTLQEKTTHDSDHLTGVDFFQNCIPDTDSWELEDDGYLYVVGFSIFRRAIAYVLAIGDVTYDNHHPW